MTRTCTIHMSVPGSIRTVSRTFFTRPGVHIDARRNEAIAHFARSRGISPMAVDYEIVWSA